MLKFTKNILKNCTSTDNFERLFECLSSLVEAFSKVFFFFFFNFILFYFILFYFILFYKKYSQKLYFD